MALFEMIKLDDRWVDLLTNDVRFFGDTLICSYRESVKARKEYEDELYGLYKKHNLNFHHPEIVKFINDTKQIYDNFNEIQVCHSILEWYLTDDKAVVKYDKFKPYKHEYQGEPYGLTADEQFEINKKWNSIFRKQGFTALRDDDVVPLIDRHIYEYVGGYQFKVEKRLYDCLWRDCYILETEDDVTRFIYLDLMEMRRFKYNLRWCSNCYLPFVQRHKKEKYCCPECQTQGKSRKNKEFKQTPMGKRHQIMNYLNLANNILNNDDVINDFYNESTEYIKNHNEYESMQWLDSKHKEFLQLSKLNKIKHA